MKQPLTKEEFDTEIQDLAIWVVEAIYRGDNPCIIRGGCSEDWCELIERSVKKHLQANNLTLIKEVENEQ